MNNSWDMTWDIFGYVMICGYKHVICIYTSICIYIYICINRSLIYFIMMSYCIYMVYIYTCRQMIYISIYLDEYSMGYDGIWIVQTWMNYNDTHTYIYTRIDDLILYIYRCYNPLYIYIWYMYIYIHNNNTYWCIYIYGYTSWFVLCVGFPNIQYTQREDWLSIGPCPMKTTTALLGIQSAEFLTLGSYPLVN